LCSDGKRVLSTGGPFTSVHYYFKPDGEFAGARFFSDGPVPRGCNQRSTYWPAPIDCDQPKDVQVYCSGQNDAGTPILSDSNGKPISLPQSMDGGIADAGRD
jgi:hypothetical protein